MAQPPAIESVAGLIEKVAFFNEETGFAILKVKAPRRRELVTVVGNLPTVTAGEWLAAEGHWINNRDYGPELRATNLKSSPPTSLEGMEKYLGSGMVKGIGPVYARKMVAKFGAEIFGIIDNFSARLEEVDGIGPKRRRKIKEAWAEQKVVRQIMVFLHSHGVSTSRAVRIYKIYGENAIERVQANPYDLAKDIHGIGFKTADQIAQHIGIPADSVMRAAAGLAHILREATDNGHCALPAETMLEQAAQLLQIDATIIRQALERSLQSGELIEDPVGGQKLVFLPHLQRAEVTIARRLQTLMAGPSQYPEIDAAKAIAWCEQKSGKTLAPSQREALQRALAAKVIVITGGPGVGKTTLINSLLMILRAKKVRCQLCAPTGRAAKRMSEATGMTAKTIHRLLEVQPGGGFGRNEHNPLECDLLVVDECSMVDVPLMAHLLRGLPNTSHLVLVGDVDQLPSVGPGLALSHFIASGVLPVTRLHEVFRQAADSRIIVNAHRVNQGWLPETPPKGTESDFYFIERETPEAIQKLLVDMVKIRIPGRLQCDAIRDIQVLAPMNRGSLGVRELNQRLQAELNPPQPDEPEVEKFGWKFRVRDKVIQMVNDYDKDVFNGDIGQISALDSVEQTLTVRYDLRDVVYEYGELDEIALAYAITIHKSQGSEFPVIVLPLAMQHFLLLQRNLVYTAMTRGKKMVVVIGQAKALVCAVKNQKTENRFSGLLDRLRASETANPA